jgi:hypothetical protein
MAKQQTLDLDHLRGEAQGIHQSIQAAMKVAGTAAKVELFKKSLAAAKQLHAKVKEAAAEHLGERKHHLQEAAVQLAAIIGIKNAAEHKEEADAMLSAAHNALNHISEAIATERQHAAKSLA